MNFVPFLYSDSTEIVPPIDSTIFLEIFKPKPVPLVFSFFLSFNFPKCLNNLLRSYCLIPIPVSSIIIFILFLVLYLINYPA